MNYKFNVVDNKKQQTKPIKIIFCLPGASYSGDFLSCWSELLVWCITNNIQPIISQQHDAVVYYVRNKCLGGDVTKGKNQKPYNGKVDYDYILWIDSDNIFTPEHLLKLLKHDLPIVSGVYLMKGGTHYATVQNWDEEFFKKNGYFQFLKPEDFKDSQKLVEVDYTGLGFFLVKKGVFESLEYPWFRPIFYEIGACYDFCSEDVGLCQTLKKKGYKIYIDPTVKVGHEKKVVL